MMAASGIVVCCVAQAAHDRTGSVHGESHLIVIAHGRLVTTATAPAVPRPSTVQVAGLSPVVLLVAVAVARVHVQHASVVTCQTATVTQVVDARR